MADGAVNFLLDKLTTLLMQEASLLGDCQNEVESIKLELETMRSCLKDAERRKAKNQLVEIWVRQVREVAQKVEDVLDEYIYYEDSQEHKKGFKSLVQDIINLPKNISARRKISTKLQKLKADVQEVSERRKRYAFEDNVDDRRGEKASFDWWQRQEELSILVDEDEIVGVDDEKENLLDCLLEDDPRRMVISIVGMGGLGKTTLVTKLYHDQAIQRHFDCWAWISVSQAKGVEELLRCMIKELLGGKHEKIPNNLGMMNYRQLVKMLIDYLHQKRYVIILDDVWNILLWSRIRGAFPENGLGSRVIFTTRNDNVANAVGPGSRVLHLEPLGDGDAWTLFCKKAFWNYLDHNCPKELEELAQAILKKCEGLPLAIVAIGGLMCSRNKTAVEWKKIYDSLNWQLSNNPILERVKGILLLSFNDLPFYLKHCFLYCCVFRDGYPIKRKKIIRLWIAEGFILEQKGITMEEVAEDYLTELVLRSMIQVTETNDAGRVKTFRVHDVMRELAVTTSEKENFCAAYDGGETRLEGKIQRLSVYNRGQNVQLSSTLARHLRSFFVFETETCSSFSPNAVSSGFKLLRVIEMEGVSIGAIPSAIVGLFNLRYLNLRETKIKDLPKSMERLRNLQTLDIRNTNVEKLPSGISEIPKLRHLLLRRKLEQTSSEILDLHCGLRIPAGIGKIRSLQTLASVEADEELIQLLGNLTELKRLDITRLKAVNGPKLCIAIAKMTTLHHLSVMASTEDEELRLESLTLPPVFLQKVALVGQLNRLPLWLKSLVNLTHLYLCSSNLGENTLSSIQTLPNLAFLELKKAYKCRVLHFEAGGFPRLNKLQLLELVQLGGLKIEKGALPSMRDLYIVRCQELKTSLEGIEHLASLQKLHLEEMPAEFVQRLQDQKSEDHAKVSHINTINLVFLRGQHRVVESLF